MSRFPFSSFILFVCIHDVVLQHWIENLVNEPGPLEATLLQSFLSFSLSKAHPFIFWGVGGSACFATWLQQGAVSVSDQEGIVQHSNPGSHSSISMFRALGPQQVTHTLIHHHLFPLSAEKKKKHDADQSLSFIYWYTDWFMSKLSVSWCAYLT